jgi:hypothetical protein
VGTTPTPTPTLPAPDDAYSAFKTAEGNYTNAVQQKTGTAAALAAAQQADAASDSGITSTGTALKTAADTLIASLEAFEGTLPASVTAGPLPSSS